VSNRPPDSAETRRRKSEASKCAWADPAQRKRRIEAIKNALADPEVRKRISEVVKRTLADPDKRKRMIEVNRRTASDPEVRRRKGEATKRTWANPEVRRRRSDGIKRAWDAPGARQRRREAMKRAFAKPESRQSRSAATKRLWADPSRRKRWSEARKRSWTNPKARQRRIASQKASWTPERRARQGEWSTKLWNERRAALNVASLRPADWKSKRLLVRIIANYLLFDGPVSNRELGKILDKAEIIPCPSGGTWSAALSSAVKTKSTAKALVAKARMLVNKPGRSHRQRARQSHPLEAKARLTPAERSASARRAAQVRWTKPAKAKP
jgi:hypothetical protein